jgi:hypothetical protein
VIGATSSRVQVAQTHGPCAHSCLHSDNAFVFVANFTFAHDFPDDNLQSASHTLLPDFKRDHFSDPKHIITA